MNWNFEFEGTYETITLQNLLDLINSEPETGERVVSKIIMKGKCFTDNWERTLADCEYDGCSVIVLMRAPQVVTAPRASASASTSASTSTSTPAMTSASATPATPATPATSTTTRPQLVLNPRPPPSRQYFKSYTGAEVKAATLKSGDIMFNIICDIAKRNPFYLSYLAVNPSMAKKELMSSLDEDDFKLTIVGPDSSQDPIFALNMHPSGDNGHEIDLRNVEFLIMNSGVQHNADKAMDVYLWCDRDIQRTLSALQNPAGCPLLVNNNK